ncbi:MAG: Restriction endonuclease subunit-like protein [Proteobacteria bacterium]|nr:Restriction endonuclease subunit-like protein [Pseudomonadota bacterium]
MKWHSFSEVVADATAKFKKIKASDYHSKGRYKIIDQGKEAIAGYTDDANLVNGQLLPILIFGDHTRVLKYEDDPIALGADGAKALWVNSKLANARYVYYYLRSIQIKAAGYSRHFKFLKELEIPIPFKDDAPDLNAQIRIAHLLGKVEGLIAQRKQHLQQLDDLLKIVFLEMFGFRDGTYTQWAIERLAVYTEVVSGVTKGKKYTAENLIDVPYLRVANVQDGHFVLNEVKTIAVTQKEIDQYQLRRGDLLLTEGGDPDKLGRGSVWEEQVPDCIHQNHIFRVRINDQEKINPYYLSALIGSRYGKRYFLKSAKQTTGIASINSTQLKAFPTVIPPISLQDQFAAIVEKVERVKACYQRSLTDLEALYGTLSQKAFKGELDLSRVPLPADQAQQADPVPLPEDIVTPTEVLNRVVQFAPPESRSELLSRWFNRYLANTSPDVSLDSREFLEAGWQTLQETRLESEGESPALTLADYDALKDLIFAALEGGTLVQTFAEESNRVSLHRRPADWGSF